MIATSTDFVTPNSVLLMDRGGTCSSMDLNLQKDHFSRSVVRAIAAVAGVGADVRELDQNSVDVSFKAPDTAASPGAQLDAQLKCTQNLELSGDSFSFPLPVKNYNDLRHPWPSHALYVRRILVVVHVPESIDDWMKFSDDCVKLKKSAYWLSLAGYPATTNSSTVSVSIPASQVFDVEALRENLEPPGGNS